MQLILTVDETIASALISLSKESGDTPETLATKFLQDTVLSAVEDPELIGINE